MDTSFQETQVPAPSRRDPAYHGNMAIDKVLSSTTLNTHANFHFQGQQCDRQDPNMETELSSMIYPAKNEEAGQANGVNGNDDFENNVWDSRAFYTNGPHGMRFDANGLNGNMLNSNGIDFNANGPNGNNTNGPNDIVFDPNGLNGYMIFPTVPTAMVMPKPKNHPSPSSNLINFTGVRLATQWTRTWAMLTPIPMQAHTPQITSQTSPNSSSRTKALSPSPPMPLRRPTTVSAFLLWMIRWARPRTWAILVSFPIQAHMP